LGDEPRIKSIELHRSTSKTQVIMTDDNCNLPLVILPLILSGFTCVSAMAASGKPQFATENKNKKIRQNIQRKHHISNIEQTAVMFPKPQQKKTRTLKRKQDMKSR
jgi:hypothetical protein